VISGWRRQRSTPSAAPCAAAPPSARPACTPALARQRPTRGREAAAAAMTAPCSRAPTSTAQGEGRPGETAFRAYNALNRLAIEAMGVQDDGQRKRRSIWRATVVRRPGSLRTQRSVWDAIMDPKRWWSSTCSTVPDADRRGGEVAFGVRRLPRNAGQSDGSRARWIRLVAQLCLLSRFCDAWAVASGDSAWQLAADRLLALASGLHRGLRA
jgi:hypothetical protein